MGTFDGASSRNSRSKGMAAYIFTISFFTRRSLNFARAVNYDRNPGFCFLEPMVTRTHGGMMHNILRRLGGRQVGGDSGWRAYQASPDIGRRLLWALELY